MENKELITLLRERGYEVGSSSSTISNIDAEALLKELKPEKTEEPAKAPEEPVKQKKEAPKLPTGKIVKSAKEISAAKESASEQKTKAAPIVKAPPTPPTANTPPSPAAAKSSTPPSPPPPSEDESQGEDKDNDAKIITVKPPIVVRDFAEQIGLKPFKLISELMEMDIFASMNQSIEEDVATKIAEAHGFLLEVRHRGETQVEPEKKKVEEKPKVDESKLLEPRPPVVCVLGHVDHGKTTLLDTIRKADVVSGEAGGITQHVGAYQVNHNDRLITFIDTPGHAAFSKMRERGANVTDVAILVVAADDGFMPQTDEALKFARNAGVPVVVAINKTDVKGANIDKVKQQMQERDIAPEDWGGETLCANVSALKGEGIDTLLEQVLLQAEILELKANPQCPAEGIIVESQVEPGRGPTATVIVQKGTLKVTDTLVCGPTYCKLRAMTDEHGETIKKATPSTPTRMMGWSSAPEAGEIFIAVKNERDAKRQAEETEQERKRLAQSGSDTGEAAPADIDQLMSAIASAQEKVLKVIIKGDVHGSVEALAACLEAIESDKISLEIISAEVGQISKNDIVMASAAEATVVGFNVKQETGVPALIKHHAVHVIHHNIIYELIDQVKETMGGLLDPEHHEHKIGAAEVRQKFPVAKGVVAGCMVTEGRIAREGHARVRRKDEVVFEGKIGTLKRFKDDVNEVRAGYECGIQVSSYNDYEEGDIIECYEIHEVQPEL